MNDEKYYHDQAIHAASNADWDEALRHAKRVPDSFMLMNKLARIHPKGIPDKHMRSLIKILNKSLPLTRRDFMNGVSENLSKDLSNSTLHHLWNMTNDEGIQKEIEYHPNFQIDSQLHGPATLWYEYERDPHPNHLAAVEAWKKNKDSKVQGHRGETGYSDSWLHVLPEMEMYSKAAQHAILNDPTFEKRRSGKKTFVKLYRGVGGAYGKAVHDAFKYNAHTREADLDKNTVIPTAIFSSWSRDKDMAQRFAEGRGALNLRAEFPQGGVVMEKWVPIENVLHSGKHALYPGHPKSGVRDENEVVVYHPNKKMRLSGSDVHFPSEIAGHYKPATDRGIQLEKGRMKDYVAALGVAAAMLGHPVSTEWGDDTPNREINKLTSVESHKPHPSLDAIKMVESSGNKNIDHREVEHGLNAGTTAIGMYGFMPIQVQDTINFDPQLRHKYKDVADLDPVKDQEKIRSLLVGNEQMQHELANSHWKRLSDRFDGNEDRMAYAWKNGITGALKASDDEVKLHPYVRKYHGYKELLDLEDRTADNMQKSEQNLADKIKDIRRFISVDSANKEIGDRVTALIQDGLVHDMSNLGHFTHSSFIVGPSDNDAWLIKVESDARPAIKSAQYGLQTVKEAAFYEAARKVFGMSELVPEAYLGELQKKVPNSDRSEYVPAVAIRLLPKSYRMAADYERQKPGSMEGILEPYRRSGIIHKIAAMYLILGEADAHGKNMMTDGKRISLIDHGTSFADASFNPANDDKVFIPYVLRVKRVKDHMTPETKLSQLAKVSDPGVLRDIKTYILSLSEEKLRDVLTQYNIDPNPEIERLRYLKQAILHEDPSSVINRVWVYGKV